MPLTIVTYHYIRNLECSRFPTIKGRTLDDFKGQLDYIDSQYTVVTAEDVLNAVVHDHKLPDNAAWLTFDDGYIDHYTNVFPLLHERRWQGSFFPPSHTILHGEILEVNKIHYILAAQPDLEKTILEIKKFVSQYSDGVRVLDFETYWKNVAHAAFFDTAEVIFIKRMLQHILPEDLRYMLTTQLFHKFVSSDMKAFAAELYMSADQIKLMIRSGMYIGSHGAKHYWMDRLSPEQQSIEVDESMDFLRTLGTPLNNWVMSYPFGSYNESLHAILTERGCAVAVTTHEAVANIGEDHPLALPRLDTNSVPISRS